MTETDIGATVKSDMTNVVEDFSVDTETLDSPMDQKETTWTQTHWTTWYGYYNKIPELRNAINTKATWVTGQGFITDEITEIILNNLKGNNSDDFLSILRNMVIVNHVGGDAYAEIMREPKNRMIINIKPLNPERMRHVFSPQGRLIRFEYLTTVGNLKNPVWKRFEVEDIFYLPRDRVGDEMHGHSVVETMENIILMRNEAMKDYKIIMHRFAMPRFMFHLDTDDTAKIAEFKETYDKAIGEGENLYVPKGNVVPELIAVAPNATLNPLSWIEALNDYFYETVGVPKVIIGNSKNFTDASSKLVYLAFEQVIKAEQLYLEQQILTQLNMIIKFVPPASIEADTVTEAPPLTGMLPEEPLEQAAQPNDLTTEAEGRT